MKKTLLPIACLLLAINVVAQPIITSSYNPIVGTTSTNVFCNPAGIMPGPGGAAQNWTFNLTPDGAPTTETYVDVASSPYAASYPDANLALSTNPSINGFSYFNANTASLVYLGQASDFNTFTYSDPITNLVYPMAFGDSIVDTYGFGNTTDGLSGVQRVYYDGYGSLTINGQTFNNVIRIYNVKDDTTYIGASPIPFSGVYYQWIDPAIPGSVLLHITQSLGNTFVIASDAAVGVNDNRLGGKNVFNLYPAVAQREDVILNYTLDAPRPIVIELRSNLGLISTTRTVESNQNGTAKISSRELASGVWFVNVSDATTGQRLATRKLVVQ